MTEKQSPKVAGSIGIVVSGGPAPGINSVIASVVIEGIANGFTTKGLVGGFKGITEGLPESVVNLTIDDVTPSAVLGGSILSTSRYNPFATPQSIERFNRALREHGIGHLVVIGGDGSAWLTHQCAQHCPELKVVHVPKTIDNDLPLPQNYPSFGFETARQVGTGIVQTLMTDARTCRRWFLATTMGRRAGFLALGLGIAGGATLSLIPEEFPDGKRTPEDIARVIFKSVAARARHGKEFGVVLLAEGLLDALDPNSAAILRDCPRDEFGRVRYSHIELGDVIAPALRNLCKQAGMDIRVLTKNIGYELRCAAPTAFDIEYTRFLGYAAVRALKDGHTGVMVARESDALTAIPLAVLEGPDGTIRSRRVKLESDLYRVAQSFMVRSDESFHAAERRCGSCS